nr:DJ-1/PfpI family protein [Nitrospina watsonii]
MPLQEKNILIIMPKNQFEEQELFGLRQALEPTGARTVVVSKSGQAATGMNRERYTPDGTIIDWNKQEGIFGKYHAVIVIGGKGAAKSLWDDPIVPQILVDHYRAGSVIAAIGAGIVVLARASLLNGRCASPDLDLAIAELDRLGIYCEEEDVIADDRIVTARDGSAASSLVKSIVELCQNTPT